MTYDQWAARWPEAAAELRAIALSSIISTAPEGADEAYAQIQVRLEASQKGHRLFRNNVGAAYLKNGTFVNKTLKSADLIGIKRVLITHDMVGTTIGQFLSREVKHPGWTYAATEREKAQVNWANLVLSLGGDAAIVTGPGSL
jgi:hypothetical protein